MTFLHLFWESLNSRTFFFKSKLVLDSIHSLGLWNILFNSTKYAELDKKWGGLHISSFKTAKFPIYLFLWWQRREQIIQ